MKNKEDILKNFQDIKAIRSNIATIEITENSTSEQLTATNTSIKNYIQQFQKASQNLAEHQRTYSDSIPDIFFSEQISFIADSYIISLRDQQYLIQALEGNTEESKRLFYSSYLIPVYYYLTLGDQMVAYIDTYFTFHNKFINGFTSLLYIFIKFSYNINGFMIKFFSFHYLPLYRGFFIPLNIIVNINWKSLYNNNVFLIKF